MTKQIKFNDFGFSDTTLKAINKKGFEEPTEIQAIVIPIMLEDKENIIAQAQTGTGKTAAFGLPLIEMVNTSYKTTQAIIITPTRELAIQVAEEINSLKGKKKIVVIPIYGGQSIDQQLRKLKKGVHIVVGTPGRMIDHLKRKTLKLNMIEHLILDEADEMLNMGFIEDIEKIMEFTNPNKRTLLFSATIPQKIRQLASKYMNGYKLLTVKKKQLATDLTEQIYFEVKALDKFEALCRIIDIEDNFYSLIFCRTKRDVDTVVIHLKDRGYDVEAIHGDITQPQRERTLAKFRKQKINILVATDVAARGIDVDNLTHVINYSLPQDPESYIHRIGRTGRAGNKGTAITFITPSEFKKLMYIKRVVKTDMKKSKLPNVKDILIAKKKKIFSDINNIIGKEHDTEYYNLAKLLLERNNPTKLVSAILNYCFEKELNPKYYGKIKDVGRKGSQLDQHGKTRLFVALGKKDKMTKKTLVKLIMSKVSINPNDIKDISIMNKFSFITVSFDQAEQIVSSFKERGRRSLIAHAKSGR
ncbi:MAG: DEAD/DEAH box helicase [Candidatus Marinimicrobia bacterium]|nr:DEAD/DEAH box helicase [Candidatus Neomarinimicrobiota bacterium]